MTLISRIIADYDKKTPLCIAGFKIMIKFLIKKVNSPLQSAHQIFDELADKPVFGFTLSV